MKSSSSSTGVRPLNVMAGLDPAIDVFLLVYAAKQDVDARHKAGHDGREVGALAKKLRRSTIRLGDKRWTPRRAAIRKSTRAGSATRPDSGARRPRRSTGSRSRRPCSIPTPASMAAGFPTASATPATTRSTATSKPAAARRPRSSTTRRSPARSRPSPTPRCRPRPRRWPASSSIISASRRATASSSTCRWCRRRWSACSPARALARCIRWCSAASRRRSLPPGSTMPSPRSSCPRAAASRLRASLPTSRCSTPRSIWPSTSPTPA